MKKKIFFLLSLTFFVILSANSQNDPENELSLDRGSLENQFEYVITKSGRYQEYKVVKRVWLDKLKKNVSDSVAKSRTMVAQLQNEITSQQGEISNLKTEVGSLNSTLAEITKEKDSISFFGSATQKATYKTIMWVIVTLLSLLLLFFIYKFKNSNSVTREARLSLKDIEEEFEQHRRRALEKEQKLSRQLHDALNKQKLMKK